MKLYVCCSAYHLLITLMKARIENEQIDLVIASQMPNYEFFARKASEVENVNHVYTFDSLSCRKIYDKGRLYINLLGNIYVNRYMEKHIKIDWKKYKGNIYLYNDFEIWGNYFMNKKIYYHLIEDGLNFYTYFQEYGQLMPGRWNPKHWKMKLKNALGFGCRGYGASPYATDIEVNSLDGIIIDKAKVFEVPRKALFEKLNDEDKHILYNVFCMNDIADGRLAVKSMLLCTQPLCEDGQLASMEAQKNVYADIISEYAAKGYEITIKPHPRDTLDYGPLCEQYHCLLVDRFIPTEVLNFNDKIYYDLALSVTTTAIEMLKFVKERKYLGFEYLEEYKS